jgi:hypothetical protein
MPLFCSIYVLTRALDTKNKRRRIKRRLIFRMTMMSLLSPTGRNFLKNGRWVSRYTKTPKINRIKPEKMSSVLNFFILRVMGAWFDGVSRQPH